MNQLVKGWVEEHSEFLFRLAYRLSGNAADAEDLVQQTFLKAQQNSKSLLDGHPDPRAWFIRVLRNEWLQQLRKDRKKVAWPSHLDQELAESDEVESSLPNLGDIQPLLERMPPDFREPLILHYLAGMGYREIAEQLSLPMGTVMSRLARGRTWLKNRLLPQGSD